MCSSDLTEQEAARFDRDDTCNPGVAVRFRHEVNRLREQRRVEQHWSDVLEDDPGLREVLDVADRALELLDELRLI